MCVWERKRKRRRIRREKRERVPCFFISQFEEVKSMGVVDIDTGQTLPSAVHSMNAYLGYEQLRSVVFVYFNVLCTFAF